MKIEDLWLKNQSLFRVRIGIKVVQIKVKNQLKKVIPQINIWKNFFKINMNKHQVEIYGINQN
jgi:hypothetical protein